MKQLTEYKEIIGKKIRNIVEVDIDCSVVFLFDDNTYFVISATASYDCAEIETNAELSACEKKCAGIMSDIEFQDVENERKRREIRRRETTELNELRRLQEKYGNKEGEE